MSAKAAMARRIAAAQSSSTVKPGVPGSMGTAGNGNMPRAPGQSRASQVAFAQAGAPPQMTLQQQQQLAQQQRPIGRQHPGQPQQQQYQQQPPNFYQQPPQAPPGMKISIPNAIGLATLRLGVAEENIMKIAEKLQEICTSGIVQYDEEGNEIAISAPLGAGSSQIDTAALDALTKRLDAMEQREKKVAATIAQLTKENGQFKQMITTLGGRLEKHITDMGNKWSTLDNTVTQMEMTVNNLQYNGSMSMGGDQNFNMSMAMPGFDMPLATPQSTGAPIMMPMGDPSMYGGPMDATTMQPPLETPLATMDASTAQNINNVTPAQAPIPRQLPSRAPPKAAAKIEKEKQGGTISL